MVITLAVFAGLFTSESCSRADPGGAADAQPLDTEELQKLRGLWRGQELETDVLWTFSFGDGNLVAVRSAAGEWYQGLAVFHTGLGHAGDGTVRVPPGSGVLDVDVTLASTAEFVGKPSLGTYFMVGSDDLKLCASTPGVVIRATSYEVSTDRVHCFRLRRISSEPAGGQAERPEGRSR